MNFYNCDLSQAITKGLRELSDFILEEYPDQFKYFLLVHGFFIFCLLIYSC